MRYGIKWVFQCTRTDGVEETHHVNARTIEDAWQLFASRGLKYVCIRVVV